MVVKNPAQSVNKAQIIDVKTTWHTLPTAKTLAQLNTYEGSGLSSAEARARLEQYGANELIERGTKSPLAILWEQMINPLVLLLLFAAVISALLGQADSTIAILGIVTLNAILGVVQEYRAEKAMAALKQMAAPLVRVRRDGQVSEISARELVPGDIILLEAGNIVPADARITMSANLSVQEASLTGESHPVEKVSTELAAENLTLGDRVNMIYMGTAVTYGRGTAVVTATGMNTELGRIAEMIQSVTSDATPLQRRMAEVGKVLFAVGLVVLVIAFVIGLITRRPLDSVLLNAVAIAVAVVPEGLPAVVTVALALGAQRMLRRRALIRKLPAVETLGSVTTICSDKTGTLTENRMTVRIVDVAGRTEELEAVVERDRLTHVAANGHALPQHMSQVLLLAGGALCNDALLEQGDDLTGGGFYAMGDPTEGALVIAAARFGLLKPDLDRAFVRVGEVPFSSERKRMTTIHHILRDDQPANSKLSPLLAATTAPYAAFTKGALDSLLDISSTVWTNGVWSEGQGQALTPELRARIEQSGDRLAAEGLRVLGLAFRPLDALPAHTTAAIEDQLTFVGLVGIIDPPRTEVKAAVATCKRAGIRPVMITGDHPLTALAIARELEITDEHGEILTGQDLTRMSQAELEARVEQVAVYARVSPEHKLRIVEALQTRGHIVAMTGDGVNDAPALKRSDIGVAMGITGTAVSKEAADMVILDDNFTTIVSAVEEGRTIYDNVRRFIKYLLASNTGELLVLLATQLIQGMTLPLTTLQILWMNLITDGIPALALGVEQAEKGAMNRAPYAPNASVFGHGLGRHILLVGLLLGGTGLLLGYLTWSSGMAAANGRPAWNTMVFIFLTLAQMGHALAVRSHRESLFRMNLFSNKLLLIAVVSTVVLQLAVVYAPFFNKLFNTNPLTAEQLILCLALSTVVFWGVELEKLLIRRGVLK